MHKEKPGCLFYGLFYGLLGIACLLCSFLVWDVVSLLTGSTSLSNPEKIAGLFAFLGTAFLSGSLAVLIRLKAPNTMVAKVTVAMLYTGTALWIIGLSIISYLRFQVGQ